MQTLSDLFASCCRADVSLDETVVGEGDPIHPNRVYVKLYDLSNGLMKLWSPILLQRSFDAMWHSAVLVFGYEYFFGGGITKLRPNEVERLFQMRPIKILDMGLAGTDRKSFEKYLVGIRSNFARTYYDLVAWNCNHFTDHITRHLTGSGIPNYVIDLPDDVAQSAIGRVIIMAAKRWSQGKAPVEVEDPSHPVHKEKRDKENRSEQGVGVGVRMQLPMQSMEILTDTVIIETGKSCLTLPLPTYIAAPNAELMEHAWSPRLVSAPLELPIGSPSGAGRSIAKSPCCHV